MSTSSTNIPSSKNYPNMEVNILSRQFIKPSAPSPNHPPTYNLSFFDQLAPWAHWPLLFFYPADADTSKNPSESHERLERLKKSLSETLTLFYPHAGRFIKDDLLIDCNDEGVEFLEAKVNVRLMEFLSEAPNNLELLNRFVSYDIGAPTSATTPMVAIQVTTFECGGLVLGVRTSHIITDGFTASTFLNAWATASRSGIAAVTPPWFDLPFLLVFFQN
ncbi:shikimate O-hydroxycinnamoyltransferase [Sarracenia purpurea var. burkii]